MPQVDNVRLLNSASNKKVATGTLYLTATHLIFVDPDGVKETWVGFKILSAPVSLSVCKFSLHYLHRISC